MTSLWVAALAGCASGVTPVPTDVDVPGLPNPEQALRRSIERVDAQMAALGRLSATRADPAPVVPPDLQRIVTFQWDGPLDAAVRRLADGVGYATVIEPPGAPSIPASLAVKASPVIAIFRALGDQAGAQATIELDPQHHQVRVIHHA